MRIVTNVPGPGVGARVGRALVFLLGALLVLAGLMVAIPTIPFAIVMVLSLFSDEPASLRAWALLAGFVAATVLLLWAGMRIIRGRRHMVLFLRRFGFEDASAALTHAVTGALGRRWRLVTLDDSEIAPVGVSRTSRVAWGTGRWLTLLLMIAVVAFAAYWVLGSGLDNFVDRVMDDAISNVEERAENPLEAIVGVIVVAMAAAVVALLVVFVIGALLISALGVAVIGLWRGERALRRAEGAKALVLNDASAIAGTVRRIRAYSRRVFAPRLVVVKVHDGIWREVVHELARDASVALIDVSEPTEHLLWEVELLQREQRMRMLAIGRRDLVEGIAGASVGSIQGQLRDLLVGQDVLVYDVGSGGRPNRRFTNNLSAALERIGG